MPPDHPRDREQPSVAAAAPETRPVHHHVLLPPPMGWHREVLPTASQRGPDRARPCSLWRLAEPLTSEASPLTPRHHAHLPASPLRPPSPEELAVPHACPAYWRASRLRGWWLSDRARKPGKNCSAGEPKLRIRSGRPRPAGPQSSNTTATASTLAWHTQLYRDTVASTGKHESAPQPMRTTAGAPANPQREHCRTLRRRIPDSPPACRVWQGLAADSACGGRKTGPMADLLQAPWAIGTPASRSPPNRS